MLEVLILSAAAEVTAVEWAAGGGGAVVRCKIGAKLSIEKVRRARPTEFSSML